MPAIITGDIVKSTQLGAEQDARLVSRLQKLLAPFRHEFYRGDSFQVYMPETNKALELSLLCRTAAISLAEEDSDLIPDIRISIGLGTVDEPFETLALARGEAFLLSGRALDELDKSSGRLAISSSKPLAALALSLAADYINSIYRNMTAKQAEVIFELLQGQTQQQVADKLNRSKSTISQHVSAGRWDEIEAVLKKYSSIIELTSL